MEKYYLQFETMKAITEAPDRSTLEDLLGVLGNAKELSCTNMLTRIIPWLLSFEFSPPFSDISLIV